MFPRWFATEFTNDFRKLFPIIQSQQLNIEDAGGVVFTSVIEDERRDRCNENGGQNRTQRCDS